MEKQFVEIEPNIWKPENEGDNITGVLKAKTPAENELSARYHLETTSGQFLVWGSAVLDDRMRYVDIGNEVRITYKGKTKNKKNQDVKLFKVETAK